ncbi:MAG TPA: decaprenyl-phosphate phosphoribosyltransferase [Phototrophicaceae bacterium]|nr:decaprenyl-phosphate phosphoribosyltransferase [Phototrophicaceae bacterium]
MQTLIGLLKTMRPKQWTKNIFIYAGLVFDGQLFVWDSLLRVTVSFILLCLAASSVYVINDLADIERDRQHPKKKYRPLPSGQLSIPIAQVAAVLLPLVSIGGALLYSWQYAAILTIYIVLNILYSFRLKHIVLIDILTITAGYVLRVAGGAVVIQVARFSPWLYACMALLALFLAIGKRRQELITLGTNAGEVRPIFKDYNLPLLDDLLRIVTTSTLIGYILYVIETPSVLMAGNKLGLITVPFVMYALFRYLYLIHVKGEGSAPDEVLLRDRPLQLSILLWGLTFIIVLYAPRIFV